MAKNTTTTTKPAAKSAAGPSTTGKPAAATPAPNGSNSGPDVETTPAPPVAANAGQAVPPVSTPPAPAPGAPVSGAPAGVPDLKVVMVAGVLGDHPDGVTAADVVAASGLQSAVVGRILAAMEIAGAARRLPAGESGVELWARGDADLSAVDLANAPTHTVCPTCGHRTRVRVNVSRTRSTEPGRNSDGQPTLRKGQLRAMVLDFINAHPGAELTAGTIARELNRSSGAVQNNLDTLLAQGLIEHIGDDGRTVTALTAPDTPK